MKLTSRQLKSGDFDRVGEFAFSVISDGPYGYKMLERQENLNSADYESSYLYFEKM